MSPLNGLEIIQLSGGLLQLSTRNVRVVNNSSHSDCVDRQREPSDYQRLLLVSVAPIGCGCLAFYFGFELMDRLNYGASIVTLGFLMNVCGGFALTKYLAESGEYFSERAHVASSQCLGGLLEPSLMFVLQLRPPR
jgi:hypothetical protein